MAGLLTHNLDVIAAPVTPFNRPLARKLKYVRNVGDVTSGGASATIVNQSIHIQLFSNAGGRWK